MARKYKLIGTTEEEKIRVDIVEQQLTDNNMAFVRICHDPNFETLKIDFLKTLPNTLELLSKFLGNRKFFAGDTITYVDFIGYEYIDKMIGLAPDIVKNYNNLIEFKKRIESLPSVSKYLNSDAFKNVRNALNGDMAKYGSRLNP